MNLSEINTSVSSISDAIRKDDSEKPKPVLNQLDKQAETDIVKKQQTVTDEELAQSLQETVDKVKQFTQLQSKNVDFSVERFDGLSVVVVSDSETREVLRQIPSEEMIEVSKKIEQLQTEIIGSGTGVLFDKKV